MFTVVIEKEFYLSRMALIHRRVIDEAGFLSLDLAWEYLEDNIPWVSCTDMWDVYIEGKKEKVGKLLII